MSILITGAAGYIGGHTARYLGESGAELVLLDNLTTGQRDVTRWGRWIEGDIRDVSLIRRIVRQFGIHSVLHLAASAHVGESMRNPALYFDNNTAATASLLQALLDEGVRQFVFASSSSVYGDQDSDTLREDSAVTPASPYGESKLQTERTLPWLAQSYGLRWMALRYFNVAGAVPGLGEDPAASTRIIPRALYAASGFGPPVRIFGTDLPTADGTAVRDYVHVNDVVRANGLALDALRVEFCREVVNVGSGAGASVRNVLEAVTKVTGLEVPHVLAPARPGDPVRAVSDISRAQELLRWTPSESDIPQIIRSMKLETG